MVMRCRTESQETFLSGKVSFVKEKSLPAKRKKSVGSGAKKRWHTKMKPTARIEKLLSSFRGRAFVFQKIKIKKQ